MEPKTLMTYFGPVDVPCEVIWAESRRGPRFVPRQIAERMEEFLSLTYAATTWGEYRDAAKQWAQRHGVDDWPEGDHHVYVDDDGTEGPCPDAEAFSAEYVRVPCSEPDDDISFYPPALSAFVLEWLDRPVIEEMSGGGGDDVLVVCGAGEFAYFLVDDSQTPLRVLTREGFTLTQDPDVMASIDYEAWLFA